MGPAHDRRIRIGFKASAEQFGPRELVEFGVAAERYGFDSAVVSDHYQPWRHNGGHAPFSIAWMTAVGERTERIVLGTSVLTATFRYNPAVVAQMFATMGCLYPGRVMLGIGTGEALNEVAVSGIQWPEFKERFARMREAIDLMRRLWTEDHVDHKGEYYTTVGATVYDKPEQHSSQEMERLADELPISQVAKRWIVASTPDEALEGIRPYLEAGFTNLVIHFPGADQVRFMEQFSADVAPALHRLTS